MLGVMGLQLKLVLYILECKCTFQVLSKNDFCTGRKAAETILFVF